MIDVIDSIDTKSLIEKIKSRGHWKVVIRPTIHQENRFSYKECKDMLWNSKVDIRGWSHPFIYSIKKITNYSNYVEHVIDWDIHKEVLRMYKSGQYIHLLGLWEDWIENFKIFRPENIIINSGYGLEFTMTLYTITEIYEFATRFCKTKLQDGINILIELNGTKNRRIVTVEFGRFIYDHISKQDKITLNRETNYSELVLKQHEFAIEDTLKVFEGFNWDDAPKQTLVNEQEKFLKKMF